MMNILFTVCGRAGSKGVKNKNLKNFLDAPLVYYTLAAIALYKEKCGQKDNIYVVLNTDSEDLIRLVEKQKMLDIGVIRREESLGGDVVPKVSVIKDCVFRSEKMFKISYDIVVDLDITSPLRTVKDVQNAIERKLSRDDTDVVSSVTDSRRNPYFNMVKEENGYYVQAIRSEFTARQQAPVLYDENASIYVYSTKALREKDAATFFGDRTDAIFMKDTAVLDIDSEEDFELMEVLAEYFYKKYPEYNEIRDMAHRL